MDKIEEAREILKFVGMPKAQQADICCYVLLAMAGIKPDMSWKNATNAWIRIHDIIQFANLKLWKLVTQKIVEKHLESRLCTVLEQLH